jgi:hypothetical protein
VIERAEMWFHLMLALALGTIIYVTVSRVAGARRGSAAYPPIASVLGGYRHGRSGR